MNDYLEIDIRKLLKSLLSRWYWIIGVTLLVGITVFLMFFLKKEAFEAKSKIALIQPRFEAEFNSNITTSDLTMPSEGFINNAVLSTEIVQELFSARSNPEKNDISLEQFAENNLNVELESKGAIVTLIVKAETPEEAASLANHWAELAIKQINSTYFGIDVDQVAYFQEQMEIAKAARLESGNALVEFAAKDNSNYLQIELDNINAKAGDILQRSAVLEAAESDVMGILNYLQGYDLDAIARQSDLFNFTLIQTRVYGSPVVNGLAASPIQLQLVVNSSNEQLTNRDFIETLNNWTEVLRSEITALQSEHAALLSEVTPLQSSIKAIQLEQFLLETDYSLNESTFKTLQTKLEEVTLNIETADGNARLLSEALPPQESVPHNTVRNTLIASIAAGVLTSIVILLIDWWKTDEEAEKEPKA